MALIPPAITPPWEKPGQPTKPIEPSSRGRPFVKGQSGNPKGRPKGIIDKRHRLSAVMLADADEIVRVVIEAAKSGDLTAAGLILTRVAPALKAEGERVEFAFDPKGKQTEQVESVLQAISEGRVPVDTGKLIIDSIAQLAGVRQVDELLVRIKQMEQQGR